MIVELFAWICLALASFASVAALAKGMCLYLSRRKTLLQIEAAQRLLLSTIDSSREAPGDPNIISLEQRLRVCCQGELHEIMISAIGSSAVSIELRAQHYVEERHDAGFSAIARFCRVNATLLGLAGTIAGMMAAFASIAGADGNSTNPMSAVPGISTSLRCTLFGIVIAVVSWVAVFLINSSLRSIGRSLQLACHTVADHVMRPTSGAGLHQSTDQNADDLNCDDIALHRCKLHIPRPSGPINNLALPMPLAAASVKQ